MTKIRQILPFLPATSFKRFSSQAISMLTIRTLKLEQ